MMGIEEISFVGRGLVRPECVLCHESGLLMTADWTGNGGVALIDPDGSVRRIEARNPPRPMRPNGIALEPGGSFLLADLGVEEGGVFRLAPDGSVEPVLTEVAGHALPPSNFVHLDAAGRIWITVSTRRRPRHLAARADIADGFIVLVDASGARVVADELGYTNECVVSPDGTALYVNETFGRRLSRFPLRNDGQLGTRETVVTFGEGTYPDGLCFDAEGAVWVTSIVSNRVVRIRGDDSQELILEDVDPAHIAWTEAAYVAGRLGRDHLDKVGGRSLRNISSLAFGGPGLRTAYLGCLLGDRIASFASPVAGHPPPHWSVPLGELAPPDPV